MFPQHDREALWLFGPYDVPQLADVQVQHVTIEEHQRIERLVLRGGADMLLHGQHGKKLTNFRFSHLCRMAFPMKENEAFDPVHVGVFRPETVVAYADRRADVIQEPWRRGTERGQGFRRLGRNPGRDAVLLPLQGKMQRQVVQVAATCLTLRLSLR